MKQVPYSLPRLLTCETHFVQVVLLPRASSASWFPTQCGDTQACPTPALLLGGKMVDLSQYQSQDNTKEAGEGWVAFGLSSTEVPAFRSETQQPTLFIICMADVSYL